MRPLRLLFAVLLLFSGTCLNAQNLYSIEGKIINTNNQPLAGVSIHLLNTNLGVISSGDGHFSLSDLPAGDYTMEFSAIGFATVSQILKVPGDKELQIVLQESVSQLDAVIVSAQKKEEDLQKVPFSVSALNRRQVQEFRLWDTKEITGIVPNLYSANSGDNRNVTSIRGIGTTSYDQAVATYIDGVSQFNLDTYISQLLDVDRIEVLRGPQSTLYGRNAMGGVINIYTKQPSNSINGFGEINFGNFSQQRYTMGFRSPLIKDKLFIGLALQYESRDGYYFNQFTNDDFDKQNITTGNYYLKYIPNHKWSFSLNFKHMNNRNRGPFPLAFGKEAAFEEPFQVNQNATTTMQDDVINTSLTVNYSGVPFNFSSTTAYQSNYRIYRKPIDGDFSPIDAITIINNYGRDWNLVKAFTQEFRFNSSTVGTSKLKWTAGAYFFAQNNPVKQATHFGKDAGLIGIPGSDYAVITTNKGKSYGIAAYGQGTYPLTSKLDLTVGLRFDFERKKLGILGEYQQDGEQAFPIQPDTSSEASFTAFSPKLGLAYHLSPTNEIYFTYSRGYRAGGLTQLSSDPSTPPLYSYDPEFSNNFELGMKNDFLQNRLRVNLALFYTLVNDVQVPTLILPDAITVIRNAGKLTSKGIELELSSTPLKGLELQYNFGLADAKYETLKLSQNGEETDLSGNKQIFTPDATSMLMAQYSVSLEKRQRFRLIARAEWFYLGKQYFDLANTIDQEGYNLFNARLGVATKYVDLFLWGRNLGDKKYISYAYDFGGVHLGDPRTYGATLRIHL